MNKAINLVNIAKSFCILVILYSFLLSDNVSAQPLSGSIIKQQMMYESGVITDIKTGLPVSGAVVAIPSEGITTFTDSNGRFDLHLPGDKPFILSVKKAGYKPFSLVVDRRFDFKPLKIAIMEKNMKEIIIDSSLHHLGDDKFSSYSAGAHEFSAQADGPLYSQRFFVDSIDPLNDDIILKVGSIIGVDTIIAQNLRQSNVKTASSSPVRVYLNSVKIGEISFNGDNYVFSIPKNLLKSNAYNNIEIETGVNLASEDDIDYDDIEFMNLFLEFK